MRIAYLFILLQRTTGWLIAIVLAGTVLAACHQKGDEPVPVPCGIPPAPFGFKIENNINDKFFTCDTIFPSVVRLSAAPVYTSVVWQIGTDPRVYTQKAFDITFPATTVGTVTITCTGTRPVNRICFPNDDGVDTMTKVLTVMPLNPYAPHAAIEGKFLGATTDAPRDTFTVRIFVGPDLLHPTQPALFLVNLNKGCPGTSIDISAGYQGLVFNQGIGNAVCHGVSGIGHIDLQDRTKIRFDYDEQVTPGKPALASKVFIGTRIR